MSAIVDPIPRTNFPSDEMVSRETPYRMYIKKKVKEICDKNPYLPLSECLRITAFELKISEKDIFKIL